LVGRGGYPIGYDIFEGNTFEGKTLIPVLQRIAQQYEFGTPVVVADAAMLSHKNLTELDEQGYRFIVAARIRNETQAMQKTILDRCAGLQNGRSVEIEHEHGRLIVAYSDQRARKDAYNRERGLRRLRKRISSGRLSKEHLNNRGYNRFLTLTGEVTVELDEAKVAQAARWDGLKGYLTNTKLSPDAVIENYGQLWQIERAFRISKTDLRIRPMYHYRRRRIEAHVLVAFVAYTIYKELERRLGEAGLAMSPKRAIELSQTMYQMTFTLPNDPQERQLLLKMDPAQQVLYDLLH
ncbi:MAG: IS1634 family transposase, partial [Planctomycetota bacterium]